jgi:hypothetical protein
MLPVRRAVAVGVLRVLAVVGVIHVHAGRLALEHLPLRRTAYSRCSFGRGVLHQEVKHVHGRCWGSGRHVNHGDHILAILSRILDVSTLVHHLLTLPLHRLPLVTLLLLLLLAALLLVTAVQVALILLRFGHAACMRSVFRALEVYHAVKASVGGAATLVAMRIEFLLGQDVAAVLCRAMRGQPWIVNALRLRCD